MSSQEKSVAQLNARIEELTEQLSRSKANLRKANGAFFPFWRFG